MDSSGKTIVRSAPDTAAGMEMAGSKKLLLILSCALATLIVSTYFSRGFFLGTSSFWIFPRAAHDHAFADMAQCLSGYLFYTTAPWSFPLFWAGNFGVPEGTNIALMDAVPPMALASKILFHAFRAEVNLLGAWAVACYVLTAIAFGYALVKAGITNVFVILAGTALVAMWPALLLRINHLPLLAWFTFLLSFAAYLAARRDRRFVLRTTWLQLALVCLALFVNIYLTFMTAFFAVVTLAQAVADHEMTRRRAAASLLALMCAIPATMLIIGQVTLSGLPAGSGGFGIWSLNLLSPVYPQYSGLFAGSSGVDATGGQYEGFNYLGAGVLFLLVATLARIATSAPSRIAAGAALRRHWVLAAACIALSLFAASNRIFIGDWNLIDIDLPWKLTVLLGAFRSSGRYFWPVSMVLLLGLLVFWAQIAQVRQRTLIAILAAAVILQWLDTSPMRRLVAQATEQAPQTALERSTWASLISRHRFVRVYPTVDCVRAPMSHTQFINSELQLFAAQQKREINIMNTSRPGKDCDREAREMASATVADGGLYVFLNWSLQPGATARWKDQPGCRSFEYGVACTRDWGGLETAVLVDARSDFYAKLDPVPWQRRRLPR